MKIYNTKTQRVETFVPIKENEVSLYACGPTVYNHAHIGNARPIVVFDTLKKVLEAIGYEVKFVSNYTDVDDRIIAGALEEGVKESVISERFIEAYEAVRHHLHADLPDATPKVTESIDAIIKFIDELVKQDKAYAKNGNVYFRVNSIDSYGSLSHQVLEDLQVGARITENEDKENPLDFVLWKNTQDQGIKWDSPWGKGRPGWHTECVVMIHHEFNQHKIDIHAGGLDLRFPHHENEQAQNCALHHEDLANYWMHNAMLNLDGEKMSKSLGNVKLAKDLIEQFGSNVIRWLLISNHYRQTINITDETIDLSTKEVDKLEKALKQAHTQLELNKVDNDEIDQELFDSFLAPMQDDLNTPNAIVEINKATKELNGLIRVREKDFNRIKVVFNTLIKMLAILGIEFDFIVFDDQMIELYQKWNDAKSQKDFELADKYRDQLIELGVL